MQADAETSPLSPGPLIAYTEVGWDMIVDPEPVDRSGKPRVVVRIRTNSYHDKRGIYFRRELTYLKRKSEGHNFLEETAGDIGAELTVDTITNFFSVDDGIYEVQVTNVHTDWETGIVDDWDYTLVPYHSP